MRNPWRLLAWLGVVAVICVLVADGAWWWRHTSQPEYRLRKGQDALRRGDRDEAERIAQLLIADGQADHAYVLRGAALFQQQQYDRAVLELARVKGRGEVGVEAALVRGQCLLMLEDYGQAERALLFVAEKRPDDVTARRCLTGIYFRQGVPMRALEQATEWGKIEPRNGQPYQVMGHVHRDLGEAHFPDAIDCYQEALRRELPAKAVEEVRHELAACQVRSFRWSDALAVLDGSDPPLPESAERQALRVRCLWGLGRADEARALLDRSLQDYARCLDLLSIGADVRHADKRFEDAAALLKRALDLNPHDPESLHKLALVYEALGRPADAEEQRRREEQTKAMLAEMEKLRDEAASNPWNAALRLRLAKL
ncbi:MAG TPA: tetratricopeptide repeat protein, partial [Gemmataceae bacterium]|nr:tetratricopeptide repeat protein [Gemmataceae bacterium]